MKNLFSRYNNIVDIVTKQIGLQQIGLQQIQELTEN